MSIITSRPQAHLEWRIDADETDRVSVVDYGRSVTISPRKLTVTLMHDGSAHIYLEGRQVRQDGEYGQHRRGIAWMERPGAYGRNINEAPRWIIDLIYPAITQLKRFQREVGREDLQ